MKAPHPCYRRGLTLIEVLAVMVTLVVLAGVFIPAGPRAKAKPDRIACVNNLKNLGLALRIFSTDHGDKWPMDLPVTNHGTREWLTDGSQLWRQWLSLSNGLATPKMLLCPADKERKATKPLTWDHITDNSHLSYFLGLDAREDNPQSILAGDRNLTTNGAPVGPGRLLLTTNMLLGWSKELHCHVGNLLLGDGSVQQTTGGRFRETWHEAHTSSGLSTNVWLVP
jgi:type II secretory pathway pseudopilin PulG